MTLDIRLLEILACPIDRGPLLYFADEQTLYNPRLQKQYRIHEGDIPVMLPEEASDVDAEEHSRLLAKAEADGVASTSGN
ncbi:MAG: Trm112 family protein [Acidimicrobiaceae bacterium]|nr:Trm112 family protein [Acidimicrobiaceae bacterium]MXW62678.1 Trm112 family protein [Acidimicrobiaceae bacterium]MXW74808.1 Trm112 family protein [Acidimicrobiaceae bacterium]MYC41999.1 Trm112 family protein [Acidimicrobiaceae bacterium]MYD08039.1 Trm112 family protein [Acidimicrobiaceae bacterium]